MVIYNTREYFFIYYEEKRFWCWLHWQIQATKAFSYFNRGFVGQIYVYELSSKKDIVFAYCDVLLKVFLKTMAYGLYLEKSQKKNNTDILSAWCSCMAGAYKACNHIVGT